MPAIEKELMAKQLVKDLEGSSYVFFSQFTGLRVSHISELRRKAEKIAKRSVVVKNTIARRAMDQLGMKVADEFFSGSTLLTIGTKDPQNVSKLFIDFLKDNEAFKIKGAYLDGAVYKMDYIKELAKLPSRETLIATVVAGIASPIRGFVTVLSQLSRNLVVVLDQIEKKKAGTV